MQIRLGAKLETVKHRVSLVPRIGGDLLEKIGYVKVSNFWRGKKVFAQPGLLVVACPRSFKSLK